MPSLTVTAPASQRYSAERVDRLTVSDLTELLAEALVRREPTINECLDAAALACQAITALQRSAQWANEASQDYEAQQRITKVQRLARELAEAVHALRIETNRVAEHCPIPF